MALEIFITYYGALEYLRTSVGSVLAQSEPNWTLTIVDDCFPGTEAQMYINQIDDPRIRFVRNKKNLGISETFNRCIKLSRADFLVIMGHDDVLEPGFVAQAERLCEKFPDAAIIQPGVSVIQSDGAPVWSLVDFFKRVISAAHPRDVPLQGEALLRSLMIGNWAYFPSLIWQREALENYRFRTDLSICQDLHLIAMIISDGGSMILNSQPVFRYRRHSMSQSALAAKSGEIFAEERILYQELASEFARKGMRSAAFLARVHLFSRLSALLIAFKAFTTFDLKVLFAALRHCLS